MTSLIGSGEDRSIDWNPEFSMPGEIYSLIREFDIVESLQDNKKNETVNGKQTMSGLFTNKPDRQTRQKYERQGMQVSKFCIYIYQHRACPPRDGQEKIDLVDEDNRIALVSHIVSKIDDLSFASIGFDERSQLLIDMAQYDIDHTSEVTPTEDDAGMILTILNSVDMLTRHYYDLYPDYKPLFKMINQLAKICPTGMQVIFGDDLPIEVRRAFPHFSNLFEQNRANF